MATKKDSPVDIESLDQVNVLPPADALVAAVADSKVMPPVGYTTDTSSAAEVVVVGGTTVVRW